MTKNSTTAKHELGAAALDSNGFATGFCVLCKETTDCKCDRCGDFYCSEFCQHRDWQNHRYICFPMPKLVKTRPTTALKKDNVKEKPQPKAISKDVTTSANLSIPPNGSCVRLTGFKSLNRCYICSTNPSVKAEYQKVLNEIHEFGKTSSTLTDHPKSNSYALALRKEKWCRIKVIGKDQKIRIYFIDFGDTGRRNVKEMRKISPSLVELPCFIHMVQLHGIFRHSAEAKDLNLLEQYTNKEYKIEYVAKDEVKLYDWGNNTLINPLIAAVVSKLEESNKNTNSLLHNGSGIQQNGLEKSKCVNEISNKKDSEMKVSPPKNNDVKNKDETNASDSLSVAASSTTNRKPSATPRQIQMQKACLQPPFETIPLNENDGNCKIAIVDDTYVETGFIGCLLNKNIENLNAVTKFLSEHKPNDQPYKPKFNEYCLAEFENDWYRAKVVDIISEDTFLVVYIDFTNERELTSKLIRRYPMSLTLPCFTTLCAIDGIPDDISDELKNFLELNCKSFTILSIDSVRIIEDIPRILSKELLNKLRDSKLL